MSKSWLPLCFLPHLTLPVVAIDVLPTVPVDVSSSINLLEAGIWCWPGSCVEEIHVADLVEPGIHLTPGQPCRGSFSGMVGAWEIFTVSSKQARKEKRLLRLCH